MLLNFRDRMGKGVSAMVVGDLSSNYTWSSVLLIGRLRLVPPSISSALTNSPLLKTYLYSSSPFHLGRPIRTAGFEHT